MKKTKLLVLFTLVVLLIGSSVEASVGIGLSPSGGSWKFGRQGGTLQIQISNTGDTDLEVSIGISGCPLKHGCKDPRTGELITNYKPELVTVDTPKKRIKAQDFEVFYLKVTPDKSVEFNEPYRFVVKANADLPSELRGSGVVMIPSVQGEYQFLFTTESKETNYVSVDVELTRAGRRQVQKNYTPLIIVIILVVLLLVALFLFFWLKRKKESDEIVVKKQATPPMK